MILINKNELLDHLKYMSEIRIDQLEEVIDRLPSMEIVRCKDCVFKNGCNRCVVATLLGDNSVSVKTSDVDFCSNGERSEE